jgi:hypothetical protein
LNFDDFAPPAVVKARDAFEAVDGQLTTLKDEVRAAERALEAAREQDEREVAELALAGKPIKNPRKNTAPAEAKLEELRATLRGVEKARASARWELYEETKRHREAWLSAVRPLHDEGRARLAAAVSEAEAALAALGAAGGVSIFLENFTAEGTRNKREEHARQRIAAEMRYWPGSAQVAFPNTTTLTGNSRPSVNEVLQILKRALEEPQPPRVHRTELRDG